MQGRRWRGEVGEWMAEILQGRHRYEEGGGEGVAEVGDSVMGYGEVRRERQAVRQKRKVKVFWVESGCWKTCGNGGSPFH